MDESFLRRSATSIGSLISTTSDAATMVHRSWSFSRGQSRRASERPTSSRRAWGWLARKASQAGMVTAGPTSPPMQSTAMVIISTSRGARLATLF